MVKFVVQLYCPQGSNLRNQPSPSPTTDASPPEQGKHKVPVVRLHINNEKDLHKSWFS